MCAYALCPPVFSSPTAACPAPLPRRQVAGWLSELALGTAREVQGQRGLADYIDTFAGAVRPPAGEMRAGRAGAAAAVLAAQQLAAVGVDRVCIGGSNGRKTNVRGNLDVDLVLLANADPLPGELRWAAAQQRRRRGVESRAYPRVSARTCMQAQRLPACLPTSHSSLPLQGGGLL